MKHAKEEKRNFPLMINEFYAWRCLRKSSERVFVTSALRNIFCACHLHPVVQFIFQQLLSQSTNFLFSTCTSALRMIYVCGTQNDTLINLHLYSWKGKIIAVSTFFLCRLLIHLQFTQVYERLRGRLMKETKGKLRPRFRLLFY